MEDLEAFRHEWKQELGRRQQAGLASGTSSTFPLPTTESGTTSTTNPSAASDTTHEPSLERLQQPTVIKEYEERDDPEFLNSAPALPVDSNLNSVRIFEPSELAALELFEKAVDREHVGKMADAVNFYRDAFRVDDKVDKLYREKYFYDNKSANRSAIPSTSHSAIASTTPSSPQSRVQTPKPSNTPSQAPRSRATSSEPKFSPISSATPLGILSRTSSETDLVDALDSLYLTADDEDKECPISQVPLEVVEYILCMVAMDDLPSFSKCLQSCKMFNYLGTHTKYIWKTLGLREYASQHYSDEALDIYNGITNSDTSSDDNSDINNSSNNDSSNDNSVSGSRLIQKRIDNMAVVQQDPWNGDWRKMFLERPRVRFDGLYISTCNYLRPGLRESWYTPILMVTYYRYLRFYRDGSAISLLSTDEPRDVVPVFVKQSLKALGSGSRNHSGRNRDVYTVLRQDGSTVTRPKGILNGSWKIQNKEGDILIETEGSVDRYMFYLLLNIRSSGTKKLNKLKWQEFWSVNKLTADRAEFSLKNDKAYFFAKYDYSV